MSLSPEKQAHFHRLQTIHRLGFSGSASYGAHDLFRTELKEKPKDHEYMTELLYAELVYLRSYIQKHVWLPNALGQMNRYVQEFSDRGIASRHPTDAVYRGNFHAEAFGGDRAQFLFLEELYAFVDLVTQTFPSLENLNAFKGELLQLIMAESSQQPNERFVPLFILRTAHESVTDAQEILSAYTEYTALASRQPETPETEWKTVTTWALGKTLTADPAVHAQIRELSQLTPRQALVYAGKYKLRSLSRRITAWVWEKERTAVNTLFGAQRWNLRTLEKLASLQYFGMGNDRVVDLSSDDYAGI